MHETDKLFFELICVSVGTQKKLSRQPSIEEWKQFYTMAKKQSLLGVCYVGIEKNLSYSAPNGACDWNIPETLYLKWMGMAAKIQQRNEEVNRQCVEIQKRLAADGMRSAILKGQGVAQMYGPALAKLRQSGDIDVWVDAPKEKVVAWAEKVGRTESAGYLHVGARCFKDTEVELHYRPTYCRCRKYNRRLQEFCEKHKDDWEVQNGLVVPSWEFNVVYLLSHIYRHLFGLGIGLRQLMDYYWTHSNSPVKGKNCDLQKTLKYLGLYDFAGAVMYVMREVFGMKEQYMICPVDERRGRMLLDVVMQTGNFGKMDKEQIFARKNTLGRIIFKLKQWRNLIVLYPEETLSAPIWSMMRHFD